MVVVAPCAADLQALSPSARALSGLSCLYHRPVLFRPRARHHLSDLACAFLFSRRTYLKGLHMFHLDNNTFFGRMPDGSVRVIKFKSPPTEWPAGTSTYVNESCDFDFTIPASFWPSIVASVSKQGEENGRFYEAQAFHNNPGSRG